MKDINKRKETGKLTFDLVDQNMHYCKQTGLSVTSAIRAIIKQMLNLIIPEKIIRDVRSVKQSLVDVISIKLKSIKIKNLNSLIYSYTKFNDFHLKRVCAIGRSSHQVAVIGTIGLNQKIFCTSYFPKYLFFHQICTVEVLLIDGEYHE